MLRRMTLLVLVLAAAYGCGGQELRVVSASPTDFTGGEPGLIDVRRVIARVRARLGEKP